MLFAFVKQSQSSVHLAMLPNQPEEANEIASFANISSSFSPQIQFFHHIFLSKIFSLSHSPSSVHLAMLPNQLEEVNEIEKIFLGKFIGKIFRKSFGKVLQTFLPVSPQTSDSFFILNDIFPQKNPNVFPRTFLAHYNPPVVNDFPPAGEAGGKIIDDFLHDFLNDFSPAGEAGRKIVNDFLNDSPPAGEAGGKTINDFLNDSPPGRPAEK